MTTIYKVVTRADAIARGWKFVDIDRDAHLDPPQPTHLTRREGFYKNPQGKVKPYGDVALRYCTVAYARLADGTEVSVQGEGVSQVASEANCVAAINSHRRSRFGFAVLETDDTLAQNRDARPVYDEASYNASDLTPAVNTSRNTVNVGRTKTLSAPDGKLRTVSTDEP